MLKQCYGLNMGIRRIFPVGGAIGEFVRDSQKDFSKKAKSREIQFYPF